MSSLLSKSNLLRSISTPIRFANLELKKSIFGRLNETGSTFKLFNLDLHISVTRDLQIGFENQGVEIVNWSISRHNEIFRNFFVGPDPVRVIHNKSWRLIDENMIEKFLSIYGRYLNQFDGFVVTHTPVFHEIYQGLGKPILVINSTRYEAPYSSLPEKWDSLNNSLHQSWSNSRAMIVSNNQSDSKYLEYFTGIKSDVVPSICDYTGAHWRGGSGLKVFSDKRMSPQMKKVISRISGWLPLSDVVKGKFSWNFMETIEGIFVIPYNISTMQFFEFATAGIPVIVPSKAFLGELFCEMAALQELSYFQIEALPTSGLHEMDPNNYESERFLEFWLEKADFYDNHLMPNVHSVNSFEELRDFKIAADRLSYYKKLGERNSEFKDLRDETLKSFVGML